jgi:hypothetical protein
MAPTYIKIKIREINSHLNKNKMLEDAKKLKNNNKTEYIAFCDTITIKELNTSIMVNK